MTPMTLKHKNRIIKAAMKFRNNWPDTSYHGLLRRFGFDDVADAISKIQTEINKATNKNKEK